MLFNSVVGDRSLCFYWCCMMFLAVCVMVVVACCFLVAGMFSRVVWFGLRWCLCFGFVCLDLFVSGMIRIGLVSYCGL